MLRKEEKKKRERDFITNFTECKINILTKISLKRLFNKSFFGARSDEIASLSLIDILNTIINSMAYYNYFTSL